MSLNSVKLRQTLREAPGGRSTFAQTTPVLVRKERAIVCAKRNIVLCKLLSVASCTCIVGEQETRPSITSLFGNRYLSGCSATAYRCLQAPMRTLEALSLLLVTPVGKGH